MPHYISIIICVNIYTPIWFLADLPFWRWTSHRVVYTSIYPQTHHKSQPTFCQLGKLNPTFIPSLNHWNFIVCIFAYVFLQHCLLSNHPIQYCMHLLRSKSWNGSLQAFGCFAQADHDSFDLAWNCGDRTLQQIHIYCMIYVYVYVYIHEIYLDAYQTLSIRDNPESTLDRIKSPYKDL